MYAYVNGGTYGGNAVTTRIAGRQHAVSFPDVESVDDVLDLVARANKLR